MPAYNVENLLEKTVRDIPQGVADEIILVDNASSDNTIRVANSLGLTVIRHSRNMGYGGSQKTGYKEALKKGADVVVMLHSDYQYSPKLLPEIVSPILKNEADVVFGSRLLGGKALEGGMPIWKYVSNIFLNHVINFVVGSNITEFHTGYRAYSRSVLESIPFFLNSNNFLFDTEITIQIISKGFKIKEIPIPTHYSKSSSTMTFTQGIVYGLGVFKTLIKYLLTRYKIKRFPQYNF